jgi:hypothetical protein
VPKQGQTAHNHPAALALKQPSIKAPAHAVSQRPLHPAPHRRRISTQVDLRRPRRRPR